MKRKLVLAMVLISFCGMFLLSPERVQASQTVVEVFISEDDLDVSVSEENIQEIPKKELAASSDKDNKQPILPKAGDTVTNYTLLGLVLVLIWLIMQRKRKKKE
ncbi:LPXTG cell wall anchor domain-containing protein [Listeria monocytogenes]|nr:LPXTG cell wall anchor domain-containing protein [Listeria monocytogenes]EJT0853850.1 LPXTG cell wall anchor domain-containing protein [Listeria monocytogenes]EJT0856752.1 LPXTG cell wall anchor domain-containing protein [Listeria monocytogenes]EKB6620226.1 LPXTG cell wall anchor domain-containing protein [Listeria monocytogenes]